MTERARQHPRSVIVMSIAWALVIGGVSALRVEKLLSGAFDLGFYVHGLGAVWRNGPAAPTPWAGWPLIADHFSPLLLVLSPLAIHRFSGVVLVALQAVAVAASFPIIWRVLATSTLSRKETQVAFWAYSLHPAILAAVFWDVHANVLGLPFAALAVLGIARAESRLWLLGAVGAALLREDLGVLVVLLAWLYGKGLPAFARWLGAAVGVGSMLAYVLLWSEAPRQGVGVLYPYASGGWSVFIQGALRAMASHFFVIVVLLLVLAVPWVMIRRVDMRTWLIVLAMIGPYLVAQYLEFKLILFHYYAVIPLVMLFGVVRSDSPPEANRLKGGVIALTVMTVMGPLGTNWLTGVGTSNARAVLSGTVDDTEAQMRRAVACVVPGTSVAVDQSLVPLLGHVEDTYLLPWPFEDLEHTGIVLRAADPWIDVDLVIARRPPQEVELHYQRSELNSTVWFTGLEDPCGPAASQPNTRSPER